MTQTNEIDAALDFAIFVNQEGTKTECEMLVDRYGDIIVKALQSQSNAGAVGGLFGNRKKFGDITIPGNNHLKTSDTIELESATLDGAKTSLIYRKSDLKTSDTIVIDRADKLKIALMNIVYEWGSGVGYCESRMNDHIKHAALIAAEME